MQFEIPAIQIQLLDRFEQPFGVKPVPMCWARAVASCEEESQPFSDQGWPGEYGAAGWTGLRYRPSDVLAALCRHRQAL